MLTFYTNSSETFLILSRIEWDMIKKCKVPVICVRFEWNLSFPTDFFLNIQIWNFMKIPPMEAELFHTDWRTDRHDEANSQFSQFCGMRLKNGVRTASFYFHSPVFRHFIIHVVGKELLNNTRVSRARKQWKHFFFQIKFSAEIDEMPRTQFIKLTCGPCAVHRTEWA